MAKRKGPSEDGSQDPPQERRHSLHGTRTPLVALGGLVLLGAGVALLLVGLARYLSQSGPNKARRGCFVGH